MGEAGISGSFVLDKESRLALKAWGHQDLGTVGEGLSGMK